MTTLALILASVDTVIALLLLIPPLAFSIIWWALCKAASMADDVMDGEGFFDSKENWQRPPVVELLIKNGGLK